MKTNYLKAFGTAGLCILFLIYSCSKSQSPGPSATKSTAKNINSFSVSVNNTPVTGTVGANTVTIVVPFGTTVTTLAPAITVSDKATITPASGVAQNFKSPVTYTVTADDGSTKVYTVTVNVGKSSSKAITSFAFKALSPVVTATINDTTKTISAAVPAGTVVTALVPTITVSADATVSPASLAPQDFTNPVTYTVTAADGTTQAYNVTVTKPTAQIIDCTQTIPSTLTDLGPGVDYIIKCNIPINSGQLLTINPGVTIQFDGATSGLTLNGGGLKMAGTAAKPIILEGTTNTQGAWTGIQVANSTNVNNIWSYVTIQNAGAGAYPAGVVVIDAQYSTKSSKISIQNCSFINNKGYGLWDGDNNFLGAHNVFTFFQNNTFAQNAGAPLSVLIDDIGMLDATSSYGNNGQSYIEVHGSNGLNVNTVVPNLSVPYYITSVITFKQRFDVSPGTKFQFYTDAGFALNSGGTLIANGTASNKISFVGYKAGNGIWRGLQLGNNDPDISLNYCTIDGAGSNILTANNCSAPAKTALSFVDVCGGSTAKPVAANCTITNSGGYGIIYAKKATPNFTGNTYSGNTLANSATY